MKTAARIDGPGGRQDQARELLSVDADAHLAKLTANMFPSPALLPVELVRSALARKAVAIAIEVRQQRIMISDNGAAIGAEEWQALACLADSRQAIAARERAMSYIQDLAHPGIGLLAVFLPGSRRIEIENGAMAGGSVMRIEKGRSELRGGGAWPRGTRITITRQRGPAAQERALLRELCAAAEAKITINGQPLQKKSLLAASLVSLKITGAEYSGPSSLAVPLQGDVCRIWLLHQGIPWQVTTVAPVQGLVFAAALENAGQLTSPLLQSLAAEVERLYRWLAENYIKFPQLEQQRIEDLFFRRARLGADPSLLSLCAPFRVWASQRRLTLDDVRRRTEKELFAMDLDSMSAFHGKLEMEVLLLTRQQKDFLLNHLQLPIRMLDAQQQVKISPQRMRAVGGALHRIARQLGRPFRFRITNSSHLSQGESRLCRELEIEWRRRFPQAEPGKNQTVAMIEGRGLAPSYWLKNERQNLLLVRRRHPLARRAVHSIAHDPQNSELAFAALLPGRSLTEDPL